MSKRFVPTPDQRQQVRKLSGFGLTHAMIAALVGDDGIDVNTLTKHFARELEQGRAIATATLAESLYQRALGGCVTSTIFWLKCRANWREVQRHEVTGLDGEALLPRASGVLVVPATMDPAKWEREVASQQQRLMMETPRHDH
jgi:hypothetical protein